MQYEALLQAKLDNGSINVNGLNFSPPFEWAKRHISTHLHSHICCTSNLSDSRCFYGKYIQPFLEFVGYFVGRDNAGDVTDNCESLCQHNRRLALEIKFSIWRNSLIRWSVKHAKICLTKSSAWGDLFKWSSIQGHRFKRKNDIEEY